MVNDRGVVDEERERPARQGQRGDRVAALDVAGRDLRHRLRRGGMGQSRDEQREEREREARVPR